MQKKKQRTFCPSGTRICFSQDWKKALILKDQDKDDDSQFQQEAVFFVCILLIGFYYTLFVNTEEQASFKNLIPWKITLGSQVDLL